MYKIHSFNVLMIRIITLRRSSFDIVTIIIIMQSKQKANELGALIASQIMSTWFEDQFKELCDPAK